MGSIGDAELVGEEVTQQAAKRRRKKSVVWEHFTVEAVADGCSRACCNLCKQTFAYSSGSKVAGTSHLKRHIIHGSCPKIKHDKKMLALAQGLKSCDNTPEPPKRRYRASVFPNSLFDQEHSYRNLAKMIILHDYPLHMVEDPAFMAFTQSLQPRFKMVSGADIEGEILNIYEKEKLNLMQIFDTAPGRVSLTIGLWTTSETVGYMCLTGQFVDNDWKLHRRMLNFILVTSPHSENALSEAIEFSLSDWNMKTKLFTITLDNNCSSHDIYSANLRDHLSNKNTLMLRGQLFVVRCFAHILNVVARDVIASIHGIIYNIRESVKFLQSSHVYAEKFTEIAHQLEIPSTKNLSLDVTTQWDTTYHMLVAAFEYKAAFQVLESFVDNYNEAPSVDDWKKVGVACSYLKLLHDSADIIMKAREPTANIFFQEAWKIELELANAIANEDTTLNTVTREIHEKFDKYWKDCSLVLSIAVVMDPRFKMKLVEFNFSKIYGADAARYVKVVNDGIHELYLEYVGHPLLLAPAFLDQGDNNSNDGSDGIRAGSPTASGDGLIDFDIYISEMAVNHHMKSELDQYLEEALVPRIQEFDILDWWKLNTLKYPTLSKMARDVLAIPMSMVSPGLSIFGAGIGSRVLDEYRSKLRPETLQALFCTKDWLQYVPTMTKSLSTVVKLES